MSKGATYITEAPSPVASRESVLIASKVSLISAGTERMLVGFGRASMLDKALQQPEKVKMVLEKIKTDGLMTTIEAVQSKLAQPLPLGYCNVGVVTEVGAAVDSFVVGDRVVSNGPHADMVNVPRNLCARIPDAVDDESAASCTKYPVRSNWYRVAAGSDNTLRSTFASWITTSDSGFSAEMKSDPSGTASGSACENSRSYRRTSTGTACCVDTQCNVAFTRRPSGASPPRVPGS